MGAFGKILGGLGALAVASLLVVILLVAAVVAPLLGDGANISLTGGGGSSSAVAQAAQQLGAHIFGPMANDYDPADRFLQPVIEYWRSICHTEAGALCAMAMPTNLQCVYFVAAAQWLGGNPLPVIVNAEDFWPAYAHQAGWQEIPSPSSFPKVPPVAPSIGDLMVWQGGAHLEQGKWVEYGHIAVVLAFQAPVGGHNGAITVAQANAVGRTATLTVYPNYAIQSWEPATLGGIAYGGETVLGYLHATGTATSPDGNQGPGLPSGLSFSMPYVQDAWNDAMNAGIPPRLFVKQIQRESNFNPAAVSPAGAIGIAQFMPATAAALRFDPHDPLVSLRQAALMMAQKVTLYHGDYRQALAAYNAGDGTVADAQASCKTAWLSCLPQETRDYVAAILS